MAQNQFQHFKSDDFPLKMKPRSDGALTVDYVPLKYKLQQNMITRILKLKEKLNSFKDNMCRISKIHYVSFKKHTKAPEWLKTKIPFFIDPQQSQSLNVKTFVKVLAF